MMRRTDGGPLCHVHYPEKQARLQAEFLAEAQAKRDGRLKPTKKRKNGLPPRAGGASPM
jgi:hypothetical protein